MAKAKETPGSATARKLAEQEAKGAVLSRPQRDAAQAHRNAESAKRNR